MRQGGRRHEERSSALWGTGGRGGESRGNALWGKGGRGLATATVAAAVMVFPFAAGADKGNSSPKHGARPTPDATYISPDLRRQANDTPGSKVRVIIQSSAGTAGLDKTLKSIVPGSQRRNLDLIGGSAVEIPAGKLNDLLKVPGLTITPDAPVQLSDLSSNQLWPHYTGNDKFWPNASQWGSGWSSTPITSAPTIAVVDSGIDANRADFDLGKRVAAQVNLTTLPGNSAGDGRGHGTFVAGVAAGSAPGYAGASPTSKIVSIDVMDDQGMARTSDVIAAAQWILANKDKYGIRVANFSLHSTTPSNFTRDPLDKAVEKLWFGGVTVVAAAGNYGSAAGPSGVKYAPGNDPFVITVGAVALQKNGWGSDAVVAPWAAYGYTFDGFLKPEVVAPGRYSDGPVPTSATLTSERPDHVVAPGSMELSGTSFSAPVVAGTAAQMLALHPGWTPDQVKGVLMATTRPTAQSPVDSTGVGEVNAGRAVVYGRTPPNPNRALDRFVKPDALNGGYAFDAVSWFDAATGSVSWDSVSWSDISWSDVSWSSISWQDISWTDVSWQDVSWNDISWSDSDVSWEDAAEGDASQPAPQLTDAAAQALQCDPYVGDPSAAACQTSSSDSSGSDSSGDGSGGSDSSSGSGSDSGGSGSTGDGSSSTATTTTASTADASAPSGS